jgi:hypothetical protein
MGREGGIAPKGKARTTPPLSRVIFVRVTPEDFDDTLRRASERGQTIPEMVRLLIRREIGRLT